MKKLIAFALICSGFIGFDGFSATRATTRANTNSVVRQPVASATTTSGTRGRAAALTPATTQKVSARAATTQKAINNNTKIVAATANTVVNEECKTKYYGCMDSFCMLDNANGGRCMCSNRNAELDKVLEEIQKLDDQSYAMATSGVERINMGDNADAVQKMVDNITGSMDDSNKRTKARTLNLDAWNNIYETDEYDVFGTGSTDITNLAGDELHAAVMDLCVKQMPECSRDVSMLKLMYAQQIKSDCSAYENSLKQQKASSAKKLQTAQTAMREAALEQYQNANKYDLGQCTIRFKQCMQTTADCGDDFSKCASVVAADNAATGVGKKSKVKNYTIKGDVSSITIAATTYDTLLAKKPMCESVTKQCVSVQDKVWDAFLRETAPALKSAELIAESNVRMNCIANISDCFQKACKDNIDPNDPDGSYDMCLSRPETVRSLCKVQIDPCVAMEPKILDYVYARLASMRIDACTTEVKDCLTDDNRCGADYSKCIGLDLQAIRDMCPLDKLVACQKNGQDATWTVINNIVQGIYLDIDNSMLANCTKIVNAKMLEICGDSGDCAAFDNDDIIGADSLVSYKARDGSFVIEGLLTFGNVKIRETNSTADNVKFGKYELDIADYSDNMRNASGTSAAKDRVLTTLQSTQNKINQKIALLTSDTKVGMCVNGRDMTQIRGRESQTQARYPHLLDSAIMSIVNAGLDKAQRNYSKKFDEMLAKALENQSDETKSMMCAAMAADKGAVSCIDSNSGFCRQYENTGFIGLIKKAWRVGDLIAARNINDNRVGTVAGDGYDVQFILDGKTTNELMSVQNSGKGEFVQTDKDGNMLGKVAMTAVYSADTNTCLLTTTTTMCENMKDVITTTEDTSCGSGGLTLGNGCGWSVLTLGGGGKSNTVTEHFDGTVCTKMMSPVITTQEIKM